MNLDANTAQDVASALLWIWHNPLETAAAATGISGSYLLARRGRYADLGWLAFLASNAGWILFALRGAHHALLVQQICFTATSLIGIYVWLIKPRLAWDEWRGDLQGNVTMRIKRLASWRGRRVDLHQMIAADAGGCFHTHPARALRIVLWGGYEEEIEGPGSGVHWKHLRPLRPLSMGIVQPELSHRIDRLLNGRVSYSLWLRGRKRVDQIQLRGPGWNNQLSKGAKHGV